MPRPGLLRPAVRPARGVSAALLLSLTLLSSCGDDGPGRADGLRVETSHYPVQFVAQRVGGARAEVGNLTPSGVEPHDIELGPRDVARIQDADLVVYLAGFQPAVDDAAAQAGTTLEIAAAADLDLAVADDDHRGEAPDGQEGDDGHGHQDDPHVWLDPVALADVAVAVGESFAAADPPGAATYRANAARLAEELGVLDEEIRRGLADCDSRDLVTSHQAFGHFAARYDLEQVGVAGLSPSIEPSGADLGRLVDFVEENDVQTVYFETLVSPAVARTVAQEAGVATAVLDPLEGLTDESAGDDYLAVMRANLQALRRGQGCR